METELYNALVMLHTTWKLQDPHNLNGAQHLRESREAAVLKHVESVIWDYQKDNKTGE